MLILLNAHANNGKGLVKWNRAKHELEQRYLGRDYILITDLNDIDEKLNRSYEEGHKMWIAAGGDGTVNVLLNKIMKLPEHKRKNICFGAIGLGSSNSFHKPFHKETTISGTIPVRLNDRDSYLHNVGQVDFKDTKEKWQRKYFLANASIGVLADANALFNSRDKVVNFFKPRWLDAANYYSGLKTLLLCKNFGARVSYNNTHFETQITNFSILISRYFCGDFCYDIDSSPECDSLWFALCENMKILEKLRTFFALAQQKFKSLPKTRVWSEIRVHVLPERTIALETDGEVCFAQELRFTLLKGALKVCR